MVTLVTGCAGFIGHEVARRLLQAGEPVIGLDNLNPYYDVTLKQARLARLEPFTGFTFHRFDLADREAMAALFAATPPQRVVHLAAQAGVRYSLEAPEAYVDSNLVGFGNLLEGCRHGGVGHLLYASTSSVYGASTAMPFRETGAADHPITLYAATKRANEVMAHAYAHLFGTPMTGVRFFTVYGPWGRPDMALFKFTRAMLAGEPIEIYGEGRMQRDFTYIDDIVDGVLGLLEKPPQPSPDWDSAAPTPDASGVAPWRIYNIGASQPAGLMDYIAALEKALGLTAEKRFLPIQPGDVRATWADVAALEATTGYRPRIGIEEGVARFVAWYRDYFQQR